NGDLGARFVAAVRAAVPCELLGHSVRGGRYGREAGAARHEAGRRQPVRTDPRRGYHLCGGGSDGVAEPVRVDGRTSQYTRPTRAAAEAGAVRRFGGAEGGDRE